MEGAPDYITNKKNIQAEAAFNIRDDASGF
jgi:hypothetical protein